MYIIIFNQLFKQISLISLFDWRCTFGPLLIIKLYFLGGNFGGNFQKLILLPESDRLQLMFQGAFLKSKQNPGKK